MKCPNCGAEMKDDALYCEKCGNEIQIVPDFDPEIEDAYRQTIDNIANDLWENETAAENDFNIRNVKSRKKKKWIIFLLLFILGMILISAAAVGIWFWLNGSADYQIERARKLAGSGNYLRAAKYYERALELVDDVNLKVELADTYFYRNNRIEYEYMLWSIIRDENASQEQIESSYGKLIAIYRSREDYQGINDFLLESGNDRVILAYQMYIAREPEFSILEGGYSTIQPLKLTASGEGVIYYTLDGTDPDENSTPYTVPILLERGEYTVKAYFVNSNGIFSKIVEKKYLIEIEEIPEPAVSLPAGIYSRPELIEILDDPDNVYYTTDGSDPNADAFLFTSEIPLPLGRSVFKFIRIESGISSEITTYRYELNLNTDMTPQDAEKIVIDYCQESGKIFDETGKANEDGSFYRYEYQSVRKINEVGDFYVIRESLYDRLNNTVRTGTYFAVDIYHGDLYKLTIDDGNYELVFIKNGPELKEPETDTEESPDDSE